MLEKKAAIHEDMDDWQGAVDTWLRVLDMDACNESAYQNLMILYADAGMTGEALQLYQRCRALLRQQMDAEPVPETRAIYEKILKI